jgi:hypothetical protein
VLTTAIYLTSQGSRRCCRCCRRQLAGWYKQTPFAEIIGALRAIVPLVLLLVLVQTRLLGQKIRQRDIFIYGISMAVAGMVLFNLGLTAGLVALGEQAGNNVPWAFSDRTGKPARRRSILSPGHCHDPRSLPSPSATAQPSPSRRSTPWA